MIGSVTTRRRLLASCVALPSVLAVPVSAKAPGLAPDDSRDFIRQIGNFHPRGRLVATIAMARGLRPTDCIMVQLVDRTYRERMPELRWKAPNRPHVEIVVNAVGVFEEGRVL